MDHAFQWLKYWHGPASLIGVVLIPAALFASLFALPFIDCSAERRPLRRPFAMGSLFVVLGGLIFLNVRSNAEDRRDVAVRAKLLAQEEAEKRFSDSPFEPEESGSGACAARPQRLTAQESKGALLFGSEACIGCHGPEGKGGAGLYPLANQSQRSPEELKALLRSPSPEMVEGGMEPIELKDDELDALVAYLRAVTVNREQ